MPGSIGSQQGSTGSVSISGANSAWHNSANLFVGVNGAANLTIANGGVVTTGLGDNTQAGTATVTLAGNAPDEAAIENRHAGLA